VSGFYSRIRTPANFAVDKIGEDQAADYARRQSVALEQTSAGSLPTLAYER